MLSVRMSQMEAKHPPIVQDPARHCYIFMNGAKVDAITFLLDFPYRNKQLPATVGFFNPLAHQLALRLTCQAWKSALGKIGNWFEAIDTSSDTFKRLPT